MAKVPPDEQAQTAIRVPAEWLVKLDAIAAALSRPGIPVTRSDAMRAAIAQGIEQLLAETKLKTKR